MLYIVEMLRENPEVEIWGRDELKFLSAFVVEQVSTLRVPSQIPVFVPSLQAFVRGGRGV